MGRAGPSRQQHAIMGERKCARCTGLRRVICSGEALPACLPPTLGGNRPFPAFLKLREGNSNATRVQLRTFDPFSGAATCPLLRVTTRGNDGWSDGTFAHLNAPASELPDSAPRRSGQPRRDLERLLLGDERPARPSLAL